MDSTKERQSDKGSVPHLELCQLGLQLAALLGALLQLRLKVLGMRKRWVSV